MYIHDKSKNIDYHNNNDEGDNDNILVAMLIKNMRSVMSERERERVS